MVVAMIVWFIYFDLALCWQSHDFQPNSKWLFMEGKIEKQNHLTAANGYAISMGGIE